VLSYFFWRDCRSISCFYSTPDYHHVNESALAPIPRWCDANEIEPHEKAEAGGKEDRVASKSCWFGGQTHSPNFDQTSSWTFLHAAATTSILLGSIYRLHYTLRRSRLTPLLPNAAIIKYAGVLANNVYRILCCRLGKHYAIKDCPQARHRGSLPHTRRGSHASSLYEGRSLQRCVSVSPSYADSTRLSFPLRVLLQEPPFPSSQVCLVFAASFWSHFNDIYRGKPQNRQLESTPS